MSPQDLGAVVTKSVTLAPQVGRPPIRVAETPAGMLNAIGIPCAGLDQFVRDLLPRYAALGIPVIVSIQAYSEDEARRMTARLGADPRVAGIELNLSCPNLEDGEIIGQSATSTKAMVAAAKSEARPPLIAKLSPNVTSIVEIAGAAEAGGADAICLINTVRGMAVRVDTKQALLGNRTGGLSGPAIKPIALSMVWECYEAVSIPIIGVGGISTTDDALEFLLAGAAAVQVGTATFRDPRTMSRIFRGLVAYCEDQGIHSIQELVAACHRPSLVAGA